MTLYTPNKKKKAEYKYGKFPVRACSLCVGKKEILKEDKIITCPQCLGKGTESNINLSTKANLNNILC
jgi:hypothetical protein